MMDALVKIPQKDRNRKIYNHIPIDLAPYGWGRRVSLSSLNPSTRISIMLIT